MSRILFIGVMAALLFSVLPANGAESNAGGGRFVEANGSKLWVEVSGNGGVPIVFLHGGLHHFDNNFARQREDFAPSRTVVGIDQRGHGHSPDDARPFSFAEMAQDTAEVIRQLGLGRVDVVGHSDGGNVGLKLARAHPEMVRRLVISGASLRPGLPLEEVQRRLAWSPERLADYLTGFGAKLPPGFRVDYGAVSPDGLGHWDVLLAKSYRLWLTPVVIDAGDLKAIQAPVLVISGDNDFSPIEDVAEIYRGLSKAQLFIVPGSGHGTFLERPGLVDFAIREFLDKP